MSDIMKQAKAASAKYQAMGALLQTLEYSSIEATELLQGMKEARDLIGELLEKQIKAQAITVERER